MRKEADFEVMDKIRVYAKDNDKVVGIMDKNKDLILSEVMAEEISLNNLGGYTKEWNINGEKVNLGVEKL